MCVCILAICGRISLNILFHLCIFTSLMHKSVLFSKCSCLY